MIKHLNIKITGKVQGIFFRATAKEMADKLDIKGLARNEPDGSVYIEAEGEKNQLDKFLEWCRLGPPMARVEKVIARKEVLKNFSQFKVY